MLLCGYPPIFGSPFDTVDGVAEARLGRACARPKQHAHVMRSCAKREANGLVYSRCPANTNDLATPLATVWSLLFVSKSI